MAYTGKCHEYIGQVLAELTLKPIIDVYFRIGAMKVAVRCFTGLIMKYRTALPVADPGIARGWTMASVRSTSLNGGSEVQGLPLVVVSGQSLLKLKAFCTFLYKNAKKVASS